MKSVVIVALLLAAVAGTMALIPLLIDGELEVLLAVAAGSVFAFFVAWLLIKLREGLGGRITVGTDGVVVRHLLRSHFHPWRQVHSIRALPKQHEVVLDLGDRKVVRLRAENVATLQQVLLEARGRHDQLRRCASLAAFEPTGQPLEPWLSRVRELLRVAPYRDAGVDTQSLLDLLGDVEQRPAQRVAAAVVLSGDAPEVRMRVREIVDETVEPELAEALEQAAAGVVSPRAWKRIRSREP